MKRLRSSSLLLLFAPALLAASLAPAQALASNYDLGEAQWQAVGESQARQEPSFRVIQQSVDFIDLEVTVPAYLKAPGLGEAQGYSKITLPGESKLAQIGYPELPTLARNIALPLGATPRVEVLGEERIREASDPVMPTQPDGVRCIADDIPFTSYRATYEAGGAFPQVPYALGTVQEAGEQAFVRLEVRPFQYEPARGSLNIARRISLRLHYGQPYTAQQIATGRAPTSVERAAAGPLLGLIQDPQRSARSQAFNEVMLIVTGDSSFDAPLKPFIEWKQQRGLKVIVKSASELGGEAEKIKSGIQEIYDDPEINLTYVLLVGDERSVPSFSKAYEAEKSQEDYKFGLLKGNDATADAFVGRIVAANATHVSTQVNRILYYERDLGSKEDRSDLSWIKKSVGIASMEPTKAGATTDIMRMDKVEKIWKSAGFTEVSRINEGQQKPSLSKLMTEGRGWINYMGHGSGTAWVFGKESDRWKYSTKEIPNVKNTKRWPIIVDCSCLNGAFHRTESFDEVWMQSGSPSDPTGALGAIASTISAHWVQPAIMLDTFTKESVSREEILTLGSIYLKSLAEMLKQTGSRGHRTRDTFMIFGDPSLLVRNDLPSKVESTHNLAGDKIEINALAEGGKPAYPAVVALSSDGELLAAVHTDAQGKAVIELPNDVEAESVDMVITGMNLVSLQSKIALTDASTEETQTTGDATEGDTDSNEGSKDNSSSNKSEDDTQEASKEKSEESEESDESDEDSDNDGDDDGENRQGGKCSMQGSGLAPNFLWLSVLMLAAGRPRRRG